MEKNRVLRGTLNYLKNYEGKTFKNVKETSIISCAIKKKTTYKIKDFYSLRNGRYQIVNIFLLLHNFPVKQWYKIICFYAYDDKESSDRKVVHKIKRNSLKIHVRSNIEEFSVYAVTWYYLKQGTSTWGNTDNSVTPVCDKKEIFLKISCRYLVGGIWQKSYRDNFANSDSAHELKIG